MMLVGTVTETYETQLVLVSVFQAGKFSLKYSAKTFNTGFAKVKLKKNLDSYKPCKMSVKQYFMFALALLSHKNVASTHYYFFLFFLSLLLCTVLVIRSYKVYLKIQRTWMYIKANC